MLQVVTYADGHALPPSSHAPDTVEEVPIKGVEDFFS
jgi:hypothetical protein